MVNTEIPAHYTASPSSFTGTPHLTINHEAAHDLDSTLAFEGPEKLLEVWFSPSADSLPGRTQPAGLKIVPADTWKEMLDLVNCKVLSTIESEHVDAYLLSESSMFVFPHKLILKTCGTTTLLCGLPKILEIAAAIAGFPHSPSNPLAEIPIAATPYRVFYSRKNFLFPDQQRGPHRSWRDEVKSLDKLFLGGSAYMIGKMNGEHWYLYLTEPNTILTPPATPDRVDTETKILHLPETEAAAMLANSEEDAQDETLEILMTDLDEATAKQFYLDEASSVAESQYYQRQHRARKEARRQLSTVHEHGNDGSIDLDQLIIPNDDAVDIFSNTSSENGEFVSSDDEAPFPTELTTEGHALGTVVSETCGLTDVYSTSKYPDARIDAYIFTPCGFSANGVIPAPPSTSHHRSSNSTAATHYFTVHVTPEPTYSYASFETNVPTSQTGRETAEVVEQVVSIFKPGRFSVTLFEAVPSFPASSLDGKDVDGETIAGMKALARAAAHKSSRMESIKGYKRVDRIVHDLEGYELVFRYYERHDWQGGAPRLGEVY